MPLALLGATWPHSVVPMNHDIAAPRANTRTLPAGAMIEILLKLAIVVGPALYVLGRVSHEAFWTAFGVSPALLGLDTESYVYGGFSVIVSGAILVLPSARDGAAWLAPFASLLLMVVLAASIYLARRLRTWARPHASKIGRLIRRAYRKNREASNSVMRAGDILGAVASLTLAALIGLLTLLLPIVGAHSVGAQRAAQLKSDWEKRAGLRQTVGIAGHLEKEGKLIECNEHFCAVMIDKEARALPIQDIRW